jgi:hypothetical protein
MIEQEMPEEVAGQARSVSHEYPIVNLGFFGQLKRAVLVLDQFSSFDRGP